MASTNIDAPGAYPETPANEEPTQQQTQPSSRNYTRETPRNLGGDAHSSSHYFNDSGINADDATLRGEITQRGASGRNYTTDTPRPEANDPHSSGHRFKESGIYADDSTLSGQSSKPGVMTGAFSRVGAKDSVPTSNGNYTYGSSGNNSNNNNNTSTAPLTLGTSLQQSEATGALDTPTNIVPPANTPLGDVNNTNSDINNTTHAKGYTPEDHNKVQASLRGKSSTDHTEPYWGSIPFGAGVYNGVTGHGSDEPHPHHNDGTAGYGSVPATHQKALDDSNSSASTQKAIYNGITGHGSNAVPYHDRSLNDHNAPMSTGVYNGVVGHGSNESTSSRTSRFGEDSNIDDSTRHQRAFPLGSGANSGTTAKSNGMDETQKDSHYKEAIAGASATWAGSHAAKEYSKKDSKNEPKAREEKSKGMDQSNAYVAVEPRHVLHKELDPVVTRSNKNQKVERQQPLPIENNGKDADDSNFRYYGAAAAGAGVGAYGMYKYANGDNARDQQRERGQGLETQKPFDAVNQPKARDSNNGYYGASAPLPHQSERNGMREPQQSLSPYDKGNLTQDPARDAYGTAPLTRHADRHPTRETSQLKDDDSNLGKYGAAAAAAGAGAYGMYKYTDRNQEKTAAPENNEGFGVPTASNATARDSSRSEPSQYNKLSDGTYSGIATDNDLSRELQNLQRAQGLESSTRDQSKYNKLSDGTYSGITNIGLYDDELSRQPKTDTESSTRSQPQYNKLSDGIDSGIATQSLDDKDKEDGSNFGKYGAAAATAGAGAYGMHEYVNRDRDQPKYNKLSDGTDSGIARDSQQQNTTTLPIRTQKSQAPQQSQYNRLSDGTDSGISRDEPFASTVANTSAPEDKRRGVVAPVNTDIPHSSATHSKAQDIADRSSTDSSHGGQYNVLSSGTPSGINLENIEHIRFHRDH